MRLFIAEKPELARAIASVLDGDSKKEDGYIQKDNDIVTWGYGHLLELVMPEGYDEKWKTWNLNDLPFCIKKCPYELNTPELLKKNLDDYKRILSGEITV